MPGPLPNPNARRANAPSEAGAWTELPEFRRGRAPAPAVELTEAEEASWILLWGRGVATVWRREDHRAVLRLVHLYARVDRDRGDTPTAVMAELRSLEDRLGLSARGRRENRWRYAGELGRDGSPPASSGEGATASDPGPTGVVELGTHRRGA